MSERTCSIDDCGNRVVARGWCNKHYLRWKNTGDPLGSLAKPRQEGCSIDGCGRKFLARGLCDRHYSRWLRHGDTDRLTPQGHNRFEVVDDATGRIIVTRGDGSEHSGLYDLADHSIVVARRWHWRHGYFVTNLSISGGRQGGAVAMHRILLGLERGDPRVGDHRSGDRLDNRRANLRVTDHATNGANRAIVNELGTSKYRGVCWDKSRDRWKAYAKINRRMHNLGYFDSEVEAAKVAAAFREANYAEPGYPRRHGHTPSRARSA
jgi:hypothetical protein